MLIVMQNYNKIHKEPKKLEKIWKNVINIPNIISNFAEKLLNDERLYVSSTKKRNIFNYIHLYNEVST